MDFKKLAAERVAQVIPLERDVVEKLLIVSADAKHGNYSLPCFHLADILGKAPNEIAEQLKKNINSEGFEKIILEGPFLNFFINRSVLTSEVVRKILNDKDVFFKINREIEKNAFIQFSSFNWSKEFHFSEMQSGVIGNALYEILTFADFNCRREYEINSFDNTLKNSTQVIEELENKGLVTQFLNTKAVMFNNKKVPPCLLCSSTGKPTGLTIDLKKITYYMEVLDLSRIIYVLDIDKNTYFKQMEALLFSMGYSLTREFAHVSYGRIKLRDKGLFSKKNESSYAVEVLNEVLLRVDRLLSELHPAMKNKEEVIKKMGKGALIHMCLKSTVYKEKTYCLDEIISLTNGTIPFVQYVYSKGNKILRNANEEMHKFVIDWNNVLFSREEELLLGELLNRFKDFIMQSVNELQPYIIADYSIKVASALANLFNSCEITNLDSLEIKAARLGLIKASNIIIKQSLKLIGVEVVEKI